MGKLTEKTRWEAVKEINDYLAWLQEEFDLQNDQVNHLVIDACVGRYYGAGYDQGFHEGHLCQEEHERQSQSDQTEGKAAPRLVAHRTSN